MKDKFGELSLQNKYMAGFLSTYDARVQVAEGNYKTADDAYREASSCFKGKEFGLPLQAYLTVLERERWSAKFNPSSSESIKRLLTALNLIKRFFLRKGKEAGLASEWVLKESERTKSIIERKNITDALDRVDSIIWFLEK